MAIWARIPELPMEYFDKKMLLNIGNAIGKTIKVDMTTAVRDRGRYARICVEVDLNKLLLPCFQIEGIDLEIHYESLSLLCLKCGKFGHTKSSCNPQATSSEASGMEEMALKVPTPAKESSVTERAKVSEETKEGPWKVVQRPRRQRNLWPTNEGIKSGSRFAVLEEEIVEEDKSKEILGEITNVVSTFEKGQSSKQKERKQNGKRVGKQAQ